MKVEMTRIPFRSRTFVYLGVFPAALLILLSSCSKPETKSAIVQGLEQAGAGPVSSETSDGAIRDWLHKHPKTAESIDGQCKPVRQNAPAAWADSTEGRVCKAARSVAATAFQPVEGDHQTFSSGWK
jgi:hypothetical protein